MSRAHVIRRLSLTLVALLAPALGVLASTSALPTDFSENDVSGRDRSGSLPARSFADSEANTTPQIQSGPDSTPAAPGERLLSANPLWAIPLARLSITRERPIFSPSRRPRPPAVAAAPVTAPDAAPKPPRVERPELSLLGTIAGSGDESFGIFVDQTTKAPLRLRLGEDYQGWRLRSVHGREVTLEHDQQSAILTLPQPGAGGSAQVRDPAENTIAQGVDMQRSRNSRR